MKKHQRMRANDSFDNPGDEFECLDESKIRGINRTILASKAMNNPNKRSFFDRSNSKSSFMENKPHSTRQRFASSGRAFP